MIILDDNFYYVKDYNDVDKINYIFIKNNVDNIYIINNTTVYGKISKKQYLNYIQKHNSIDINDVIEKDIPVLYKDNITSLDILKNKAIDILSKNNSINEIPIIDSQHGGGGY